MKGVEGHMNMERQRDFSDLRQAAEADPAATGLDLVERTAELIRATEEHAAEMVARAEAAASHLQEEMRLAERVLEAAETRRRIAEGEVKELKTRLDEIEKEYQERIDMLTADLEATQERARKAEARADEAESALDRIQNAMQGILKVRPPGTSAES
jgi:chromosome segregation ATPase